MNLRATLLLFKKFFPKIIPMNKFCTFHFVQWVLSQYENMEDYMIIINGGKISHMVCGYIIKQ